MNRRAKFREHLKREDGFSVPEVLISTMINALTLGAIVGMVVGVSAITVSTMSKTRSVIQQQITEIQFREDASSAEAMTAPDDTHLTLADISRCINTTWTIDAAGTISVEGNGVLSPDGICDTEHTHSSVTMTGIGETGAFSYENSFGRTLIIVGGEFEAANEARPAAVSQTDWDSTAVSLVTLSGIANAGTTHERPFSFTADMPRASLWMGAGITASASTTEQPGGSA
jgi:Tfp pilus assembly protein PilV